MEDEYREEGGRMVSGPSMPDMSNEPSGGRGFIIAGAIAAVVLIGLIVFVLTRGDGDSTGPTASASGPDAGSTPAPSTLGISQAILQATADNVADAYYGRHDEVTAKEMLAATMRMSSPCRLAAFTYFAKRGDLADPAVRAEVNADIDKRGYDVAYGNVGDDYIAIVQICPGDE